MRPGSNRGPLAAGYSRADAQAELTTILRQQDRAYVERKVTTFNRKTRWS